MAGAIASGRVPGWVWVVLGVTHAVALSWALSSGSWNFPDSDRYLQAAENLRLHGELYAQPWPAFPPRGQAVQEFTIRPLGYPLVVMELGGQVGRTQLLLVFQNLLSLLNIGLILRWWAQVMRPPGRNWLVASICVVLYPAQFIYANAVMSEMLLQTAVVAMAGAGLLFIKTCRRRYFAGAAGALVMALLVKPVFYPVTVIFAGAGLLLAWQRRRIELALIGLVPVVGVIVYMEWNMQRTGYFHFSSIAEINLLHYNAAGVVRQLAGPAAEEQWVTSVLREADAQADFAARQQLIQSRAGVILWAHPAVYARQHVQGMAALFLDPGRFDVSQFLGLVPPAGGGLLAQVRAGGLWRALGHLPLGMLGWLGAVLMVNVVRLVLAGRGFLLLGNSGPTLRYGRWVAAGLLLYVALLTGPLGAARFLVPVWPLLLGLTLVGLQREGSGREQAAPIRENQRQN